MGQQEFRLGLTYWLIHNRKDVGKIKLQKLVYFLQEAFEIPTQYSFKMYHYGPYAEDLDTDSTILKSIGYISIDPDKDGYGFHLKPKDAPPNEWHPGITSYGENINKVIDILGDKPAYILELLATLHFVNKLSQGASQEEVIDKVQSLKPKFDKADIAGHYNELAELGLI